MRRSQRVPGLPDAGLPDGRSELRVRVLKCLALAVALLAMMAAGGGAPQPSRNVNDFIAYWSAARQILAGHNPYDIASVQALERPAGLTGSGVLIMRNPPWTLLAIAPLGWLSFATGQQIWFALGLISVLISARWLRGLYHTERKPPWMAWFGTGLFLPIAVALAIGQISPLVLLGLAGFLHFEKQKKLGWAGAFLFLVALKPHIVFLLWIALLLWSVRMRTGRILGVLAAVTTTASLVVTALDHRIFGQYLNFLASGAFTELTPTPSGLLRLSLRSPYALQLLPTLLGAVWFFWHWRRARATWDWRRELPVLLLVSLLTVSYAWFFDQVVLLPCVFQATAWATRRHRPAWTGVAGIYLAANAAVLALILFHRITFWYVWTAPAWFLLYLIARAIGGRAGGHGQPTKKQNVGRHRAFVSDEFHEDWR
jgi:Glycosyltransferase family 87